MSAPPAFPPLQPISCYHPRNPNQNSIEIFSYLCSSPLILFQKTHHVEQDLSETEQNLRDFLAETELD